jgi:hypothetical protein
MQSSPTPCYLVPLSPIHPPQHSILENPQPTFLPQCERPSFTHIQNNRQDIKRVQQLYVSKTVYDDIEGNFSHLFSIPLLDLKTQSYSYKKKTKNKFNIRQMVYY